VIHLGALDEYVDKDGRVKVIHQDNQGSAAGMRGLRRQQVIILILWTRTIGRKLHVRRLRIPRSEDADVVMYSGKKMLMVTC
jgi:hypothetical protein